MKKRRPATLLSTAFCLSPFILKVFAEDKPAGQSRYVQETPGGPELTEAVVYPYAGAPCTRYAYRVKYRDSQGRPPEYVRIWLDEEWYEMEKTEGDDFKKGVVYTYQIVPHQAKTYFYYMVASNGVGVSRAGIIDSPNNGPQLFAIPLDQNKIVLLDKGGKLVWSYETGRDWITRVALSADGKYLAAKTNDYLYLFSTASNQPLWEFTHSGPKGAYQAPYGGVAISENGSFIAATLGSQFYLFSKNSNQPIMEHSIDSEAYDLVMTSDGKYIAVAGFRGLFLFSREEKEPLWSYETGSNFHGVAITPDGEYLSGTTGCPDRRAYLFRKDSNRPLFRSGMLTRDSPLQDTALSADGRLAIFSADNEQGNPFLFAYDAKKKEIIWQKQEGAQRVSRTVDMAGDLIAVGTFGGPQQGLSQNQGGVYLLTKEGEQIWKFPAGRKIASVDLTADGKYLTAGGNDNKVYLFSTESGQPLWRCQLQSWINTVSVSDDGEYVAAGTGTSVYFYETGDEPAGPVLECQTIYEPMPIEDLAAFGGEKEDESYLRELRSGILGLVDRVINFIKKLVFRVKVGGPTTAVDEREREIENPGVCGNTLCEPDLGESRENCPRDCTGED